MGKNVFLWNRALLVLYMTAAVDSTFNPGMGLSSEAAQAIYGIYVGMVYFMVIPGGWLQTISWDIKRQFDRCNNYCDGPYYPCNTIIGNIFLGLALVVIGTGLKEYFNYCWKIIQRRRYQNTSRLHNILHVHKYWFSTRFLGCCMAW